MKENVENRSAEKDSRSRSDNESMIVTNSIISNSTTDNSHERLTAGPSNKRTVLRVKRRRDDPIPPPTLNVPLTKKRFSSSNHNQNLQFLSNMLHSSASLYHHQDSGITTGTTSNSSIRKDKTLKRKKKNGTRVIFKRCDTNVTSLNNSDIKNLLGDRQINDCNITLPQHDNKLHHETNKIIIANKGGKRKAVNLEEKKDGREREQQVMVKVVDATLHSSLSSITTANQNETDACDYPHTHHNLDKHNNNNNMDNDGHTKKRMRISLQMIDTRTMTQQEFSKIQEQQQQQQQQQQQTFQSSKKNQHNQNNISSAIHSNKDKSKTMSIASNATTITTTSTSKNYQHTHKKAIKPVLNPMERMVDNSLQSILIKHVLDKTNQMKHKNSHNTINSTTMDSTSTSFSLIANNEIIHHIQMIRAQCPMPNSILHSNPYNNFPSSSSSSNNSHTYTPNHMNSIPAGISDNSSCYAKYINWHCTHEHSHGSTLLHIIVYCDALQAAQTLSMDPCLKFHEKDSNGHTPLELAKKIGASRDIIQLISSKMVNGNIHNSAQGICQMQEHHYRHHQLLDNSYTRRIGTFCHTKRNSSNPTSRTPTGLSTSEDDGQRECAEIEEGKNKDDAAYVYDIYCLAEEEEEEAVETEAEGEGDPDNLEEEHIGTIPISMSNCSSCNIEDREDSDLGVAKTDIQKSDRQHRQHLPQSILPKLPSTPCTTTNLSFQSSTPQKDESIIGRGAGMRLECDTTNEIRGGGDVQSRDMPSSPTTTEGVGGFSTLSRGFEPVVQSRRMRRKGMCSSTLEDSLPAATGDNALVGNDHSHKKLNISDTNLSSDDSAIVDFTNGVGYWNEVGELVLETQSNIVYEGSLEGLNSEREEIHDDDDCDSNDEGHVGNDYPEEVCDEDMYMHGHHFDSDVDYDQATNVSCPNYKNYSDHDSDDDDAYNQCRDSQFRNYSVDLGLPSMINNSTSTGSSSDTKNLFSDSDIHRHKSLLHSQFLSTTTFRGTDSEDEMDENEYSGRFGVESSKWSHGMCETNEYAYDSDYS